MIRVQRNKIAWAPQARRNAQPQKPRFLAAVKDPGSARTFSR
jgi:hypothetical protein